MRVERIIETCVYADDLAQAEEFYSRVLGLGRIAAVEGRHVFFRCGEGVFLVFNPAATVHAHNGIPAHGAVGRGHVAFGVGESELAPWRERLKSQGVEIESEFAWPNGGYSIYFRDPAGNSVELVTPAVWGLNEYLR